MIEMKLSFYTRIGWLLNAGNTKGVKKKLLGFNLISLLLNQDWAVLLSGALQSECEYATTIEKERIPLLEF